MKSVIVAGILACGVFLVGCESSSDDGGDLGTPNLSSGNNNPGGSAPVTPASPTAALFQPLQGVLPFPTDVYFSGSTDGTLNIQPANALIPSQAALNALDGFSTNAVIRARFGGAINPSSLNASTVRVIQVATNNTTKAPGPPLLPLMLGVDFEVGVAPDAGVGASILEIRPLRPLEPSGPGNVPGTGYLVILTNGITMANGQNATPDNDYAAFKTALAGGPTCPAITQAQLNLLCQLTGAHLSIAQALTIDPASVVLSFSFTTQSVGLTLGAIAATAQPQPIGAQFSGINTSQLGVPGLTGDADIYVGTLRVPYYLSRQAPTTGSWQAAPFQADPTSRHVTRFNPVPVATEQLTIPLLVTVPNANATGGGVRPAAGWPVLIFQHGITQDRTNLFGVADAYANAGFVVVGIDQPLHGITDTASPLYGGNLERTFNLDLINNSTGAAGPDGVIDDSGAHFIQLTSLLTSRDNVRQAAADLITLTRSLPDLDLDGNQAADDIDASRLHFLGHSLGGIVGTPYLAVVAPNEVVTGTLAMAGGKLAQLLRDSASFGPPILQGLAARGLTPGSTLLEQFFRDAQTALDAADPLNYIAAAAAARPTLAFHVVGDGASVPPDQVVPNSASQRLADQGALARIARPGTAGPVLDAAGHRKYVNFIAGDHGSIIDPSESLAATQEMQTEAISFATASGDGSVILIGNPAVIQP